MERAQIIKAVAELDKAAADSAYLVLREVVRRRAALVKEDLELQEALRIDR